MSNRKSIIVLTGILVITVFCIAAMLGDMYVPESSGAFEMTGELRSARWSGSLYVGAGEAWNTTSYDVILTAEEAERVEERYTTWRRKGGPSPVTERPGFVFYSRESTGNWCGELPPEGSQVKITSRTGYTMHTSITDLETGQVYWGKGGCERPMMNYKYRVYEKTSGNLIREGDLEGRDIFEVTDPLWIYFEDDNLEVQYWQVGEDPPEPYKPD